MYKEKNLSIIFFQIIIIGLLLFASHQSLKLSDKKSALEYERFEMVNLANMLHKSSENLTRFARSYVATADKRYLRNYFEVLNIREGKTARPSQYTENYWHLSSKERELRSLRKVISPLRGLLDQQNYVKEERGLLDLAHERSNTLVYLEKEAFSYMKKYFSDAKNKELWQEKASKKLFGQQYMLAVVSIQEPIEKSNILVYKRTSKTLLELSSYIDWMQRLRSLITFIFILGNVLIYRHLCAQSMHLRVLNSSLEKKVLERTRELEDSAGIISRNVLHSRTDTRGIITEVSEAFCRASGYTKEELVGKNHNILRHPDTDAAVYKNLWETIQKGEMWVGRFRNVSKNGESYWMKVHITPEIVNGEIAGYLAIREDITAEVDMKLLNHELKQSEDHFRRLSDVNQTLANTDALTGVLNRRALSDATDDFCDKGGEHTLMMIDIDDFKEVNDTYGHDAGDEVLKAMVNSCRSCLRDEDLMARIGGEEFVVILFNSHQSQAKEVAQRILHSVAEQTVGKEQIQVTVSIGMMISNTKSCKDFSQALKEADKMLYKAKELGKNQYQI